MSLEKTSCLDQPPVATAAAPPALLRRQMRRFVIAAVLIALGFSLPLGQLAAFAWSSDLYSYILLMPLVAGYLIHLKKPSLPPASKPLAGLGVIFFLTGTALLAGYGRALYLAEPLEDALSLAIAALFLFLLAAAAFFLGRKTFGALAFPLGILIFMVPMPTAMMNGIETFLQYGSALPAYWLFKIAGTPVLLTDLTFRLPGGSLVIAPECSGIHSSLILFITSLMAGSLFLRSPWHRFWLALVVLPLALLRNGFRVFVIGELCVHIDWSMIDSYIHRHGGPIFFLLSLVPFFGLLALLYKRERSQAKKIPVEIN